MNSSLQDYEVLKIVGSGSFGTCYKVRNIITKNIYVWKAIDYSKFSEQKKKLLCNEVNFLSGINHPYIVKYYSRILHKDTTTLYIIMEWCEGGDLSAVIKETYKLGKMIEEWYIWRVVYQLGRALEYLHNDHNMAHRDVKASNVFIDNKGNIKLGDFGLSCAINIDSTAPQVVTVGTLQYISPETLKGSKYSFKSDIWSFGCLIYELCALMPPFHGVSMAQIISNIKAGRYQRIPTNYSESLSKIVNSMLTVAVDVRPSAKVITRHPEVVANQVSTPAYLASSSSSSNAKKSTLPDRFEITQSIGNITLNDEPEDVSKKIFKDKYLAKLESVRSKEARLREKQDKLVEREHSLDRREKRLTLLERKANEKFERAQVYLNRIKEPKQPLKDLTNSDPSYSAGRCDLPPLPTIAKLDPSTLPRPNFGEKRPKHVHFKSTSKLHRNSTELSYFQVSTGEDSQNKTLIKGLRYSSCQIIKPSEQPGEEGIRRNSVSRLSMRQTTSCLHTVL